MQRIRKAETQEIIVTKIASSSSKQPQNSIIVQKLSIIGVVSG
jgi:hypothetical protein